MCTSVRWTGIASVDDNWQTTSRSAATRWPNIPGAEDSWWNLFAPSRESDRQLPTFVGTVMMPGAPILPWSLLLALSGSLINRLGLSVDKHRQGTLPGWLIPVMLAGSILVCARAATETDMRLLVIPVVVMAGIAPIRALNLFAAGTRIAPAVNSLRDGLTQAGLVIVFGVSPWPQVVVDRTLPLSLERPAIQTSPIPGEGFSPTQNPASQGHQGAGPAAR